MLLCFVTLMGLMFAAPLWSDWVGITESKQLIAVLVGFYAVMTVAALAWLFIDKKRFDDSADQGPSFSQKRASIGKTIAYIVGGFIVALAIQVIGLQLTMFLTGADTEAVSNADEVKSAIESSKLFIFAVIIAAPIIEEVVFRGILFKRWADAGRYWPALTISSALFAFAHLQGYAFFVFLLLGLLFAYLYRITNRLSVPITVHFMNNGIALLGLLLTNQL